MSLWNWFKDMPLNDLRCFFSGFVTAMALVAIQAYVDSYYR